MIYNLHNWYYCNVIIYTLYCQGRLRWLTRYARNRVRRGISNDLDRMIDLNVSGGGVKTTGVREKPDENKTRKKNWIISCAHTPLSKNIIIIKVRVVMRTCKNTSKPSVGDARNILYCRIILFLVEFMIFPYYLIVYEISDFIKTISINIFLGTESSARWEVEQTMRIMGKK